ncbi:PTS sugar transporter subunit IIA [Hydrogenophaga sp.]|uniref:PTS sugar transporter subunit IIA n=1 Tax=Hydrogenophaga sp. TaxID=1904254 RepID=UPI00272F7A95|nr:PTS sugar transporter subunit IIA [Hydrogenophaga sp.]MDP2017045.1 PTS sugar transporter subunit IIA [Hydrogenophaga sp.]MDP3811044.1 PTS sugar transporter subunit IIA [Hydrogenophaga sp.]
MDLPLRWVGVPSGPHNVHEQLPTRLDVEVHLGVRASDAATLFSFVDDIVADGKRIRNGAVAQQLALRQTRSGTALGRGVVVPHAAVRRLPHARLIYVRLQAAIDMDTPDHEPVRDALTLLVRYPPSPADHALLERIRDPHMNPVLIDLLRQGLCAEAVARLANPA